MYLGGTPGLDLKLRNRGGAAVVVPDSGLLTGLVSYWKMDETSGTRVDSVVASGNDLTDNNTVASDTGKVSNAGLFVRANSEWLSRADNASLSTGDIDFTFVTWVYMVTKPLSGAVGNGIVGKWKATTGDREHLLYWDDTFDRFLFVVSSDGATSAFVKADNLGAPSAATWYMIVGWHDSAANTINISVNNGTVNSLSHSAGVRDGASALQVGAYGNDTPSGTFLDGRVDEIGFWKRTLTATEITNLYNAGSGITYPFTGVA